MPASSNSNPPITPQPVFVIPHSRQETICREVYDHLITRKIQKLKAAILEFNHNIRRMLR